MDIKHIYFRNQFIIIFLLLPFTLRAQNTNIKWGALNEDKHKIDLNLQFVGKEKNTGTTLWMKKSREGYFLEKFDENDIRTFSKNINCDSLFPSSRKKTIRFSPMLYSHELIYLFAQYIDRETKLESTALLQLSPTGKVMMRTATLFTLNKAAYYTFTVSPDSLLIGVAQIITEKKENHVTLKTFDRSLDTVAEFKSNLDKPDNENVYGMGLHNMLIDNSGDFLLEVYLFTKNYERFGSAYWLVNPIENTIKRVLPALQGAAIETSEIAFNPHGGFEVAGISQQPNPKPQSADNHLLFFGLIDKVTGQINILRTMTFKMPHFKTTGEREYYSINTSTSVSRKDGGIIVIVEQQLVGKKNLWVHINDIFVTDFNPDGSVNYFKEIEKNQSYLWGPYISAYSILPVYDQYSGTLHLIFNTNEATGTTSKPMRNPKRSMPVIVSIVSNGNVTKKQLAVAANKSIVLSPMWSRQISNSEVMVGGIEKHGYRIGRLDVNGVRGKYLGMHKSHYHPRKVKMRRPSRVNSDDVFIVGGFTSGISSPPNAPLTNWLNQNGYPTHYNNVSQDVGLFFLAGSGKKAGGLDFSTSQSAIYTPEIRPRFAKTRFAYVYARPLKTSSTSKSFFCFGVGFSAIFFDFTEASFPQVNTQPSDFTLSYTSLLINPSYRVFTRVGRNGFITGLDIGARLNLFPGKWRYDDATKHNITVSGMPSVSTIDFYINFPIPILSGMTGGGRR